MEEDGLRVKEGGGLGGGSGRDWGREEEGNREINYSYSPVLGNTFCIS